MYANTMFWDSQCFHECYTTKYALMYDKFMLRINETWNLVLPELFGNKQQTRINNYKLKKSFADKSS